MDKQKISKERASVRLTLICNGFAPFRVGEASAGTKYEAFENGNVTIAVCHHPQKGQWFNIGAKNSNRMKSRKTIKGAISLAKKIDPSSCIF